MSDDFKQDFEFINNITDDFINTNFVDDNCFACERFSKTLAELMVYD